MFKLMMFWITEIRISKAPLYTASLAERAQTLQVMTIEICDIYNYIDIKT